MNVGRKTLSCRRCLKPGPSDLRAQALFCYSILKRSLMFRAPDGKEFRDRAAYRKYLFLTQYTFKDRCEAEDRAECVRIDCLSSSVSVSLFLNPTGDKIFSSSRGRTRFPRCLPVVFLGTHHGFDGGDSKISDP